MARRMFTPQIVSSDAFLEMPISSQALYFHLGMNADDDGFVNPKRVIRMVGVGEDDLKILLVKKFVIQFENGVLVIKHWRMNNLVRKDWYRPTQYVEQKELLFLKENGSYTLDSSQGNRLVKVSLTNSLTQDRLGKVINTPASLVNNTKKMNTHDETRSSDSYEKVIDADENEIIEPKKVNIMAKYREMLAWAEKRKGKPFVYPLKQMKALKDMRIAEYKPNQIMDRWEELEKDKFYSINGIDFITVAASFDKRPLK